jgi:hypothetical protein
MKPMFRQTLSLSSFGGEGRGEEAHDLDQFL